MGAFLENLTYGAESVISTEEGEMLTPCLSRSLTHARTHALFFSLTRSLTRSLTHLPDEDSGHYSDYSSDDDGFRQSCGPVTF